PVLTLSQTKDLIASIENTDLTHISIDALVARLTPLFVGYTVDAKRFRSGLRLYRAQMCDKCSHIARLTYPPSACVKSLGRVNTVGESVLYVSTSREAPFFESSPVPGSRMNIVRWQTTAPLLANVV